MLNQPPLRRLTLRTHPPPPPPPATARLLLLCCVLIPPFIRALFSCSFSDVPIQSHLTMTVPRRGKNTPHCFQVMILHFRAFLVALLAAPLPSTLGLSMCSAAAAAKPAIRVDVVSDIACPWCWVGKRRLDKAIKQLGERANVTVHWLPYQVDPTAPSDGVEKTLFYPKKFGASRFAQMVAGVQQTYASEGMTYSMGGLMGNTRNAHRLLAWAAAEHGDAQQHQLAEEFFFGYHTKEQFINDRAFLLRCVEAAGLPVAGAAAILDDPAGGQAEALVQAESGKYASAGGVPSFIIGGRYRIGGAQTPDVFLEVFEELISKQAAAAVSAA